MSSPRLWFAFSLLSLLVLCPPARPQDDEEGSDEEACSEDAGSMAMFVEKLQPVSGSKDVPVDSTIELVLREELAKSMPMLDMLRIKVSRDGADTSVKGEFTFDRASRKFKFVPKQPLRPGTKYVARLIFPGSDDSEPVFEWKFETAASGDARPPAPPKPPDESRPDKPTPIPPKEQPKEQPKAEQEGRRWEEPILVGRALRNLDFLEIVPDTRGGALLAWCAEGFLWSSSSPDGVHWSKPEPATQERLYEPNATASRAGHLLVCGGTTMLWSPGRGWQPLPTPPFGRDRPDLLVVRDREGVLVRQRNKIFILGPDGKWETALDVNYGSLYAGATTEGEVLVLFRRGSDHPMQWTRLTRDARWTEPALVAMAQSPYEIVQGDNGDAFAYWINEDPDRKRLFTLRFTPRGGWERPEPADDADIDSVSHPTVHVDKSGRALALYKGNRASSESRLWQSIYLPGRGWQRSTPIEGTENAPDWYRFKLNASGEGIGQVTPGGFGGGNRVYLFDFDKGWHAPLEVMHSPPLAIADDGTAFVAVSENDRSLRIHRSPRPASAKPGPGTTVEAMEKAAGAGDAEAQWRAACAFLGCEGYPFDAEKALSWMRKSAEQGFWKARLNLAHLDYLLFRDDEALGILRELAQQGHADAQAAFGSCALTLRKLGRADPALRREATEWLRKGADAGSALACEWLVNFHIEGLLEPGMVSDAQAVKYLERAVQQGRGLGTLAGVLDQGLLGLAPDPGRYRDLTRQLAESGEPAACSNVGTFHAFGQGVPVNVAEAVRWYELAAKHDLLRAQTNGGRQGILQARFNLGVIARDGLGGTKDREAAWQWFHSAAMGGYVQAMNSLGVAREHGEGCERDVLEATVWYCLAAARGDDLASKNVGRMRQQGILDERNAKEIEVRVRARENEIDRAIRASLSDRNVNPQSFLLPEGMTLRLALINADFGTHMPVVEEKPKANPPAPEDPRLDAVSRELFTAWEARCYTLARAGVRGASFDFNSEQAKGDCVWDGQTLTVDFSTDFHPSQREEHAAARAIFPRLFENLFHGRGLRLRFQGSSLQGSRKGSTAVVRVSGGPEDGAVIVFDELSRPIRIETGVTDPDTGARIPATEEFSYHDVGEFSLLLSTKTSFELAEIPADPQPPGRGRGGGGGRGGRGGPPGPKRPKTLRTITHTFAYKEMDGLYLLAGRAQAETNLKDGKESAGPSPELYLTVWRIIERDRAR